jgi:protein transport protein SEC20
MRSELFSSSKSSAQSRPSKAETHASKDDELMSATSNVTDGLRRTRQLMEQELERSVLSTQMLGK